MRTTTFNLLLTATILPDEDIALIKTSLTSNEAHLINREAPY